MVHSRYFLTCTGSLGKQQNAWQDMPHYGTIIYNMSPYDALWHNVGIKLCENMHPKPMPSFRYSVDVLTKCNQHVESEVQQFCDANRVIAAWGSIRGEKIQTALPLWSIRITVVAGPITIGCCHGVWSGARRPS